MNWLKNPLSSEELKFLLPHRYSFLLIDRVLSIELPEDGKKEGRTAECVKCLTATDPVFFGHFPGNAIFPGVMQLEAMAQASCLCILPSLIKDPADMANIPKMKTYLLSADGVKFRKIVGPGDRLNLRSKVLRIKRNIWQFECQTLNEGTLVSEATVMAMVELENGGIV